MKKWKQALALVLALVMALSLVALPSFAEGEETGGGTETTQPVWPAEGSINLSKKAQPVEGQDGLYELTLTIQGKNYKTTSDVVLVIDCSGSMEGTKLANTQKAAKAFGDKLLTENSATRIAIVTYSGDAAAYSNGRFYTADELSAFKTAVDDATYANGGTNQQAGIHVAQQLLASDSSTGRQKNIVILSDGEPTYSHPFVATATYEGCSRISDWGCGEFGPTGGRITNIGTAFTPDYNTVIGSGGAFTTSYNAYVNATCTEHGTTSRLSYGVYALDGTVTRTSGTNNGVATIWEANQAKTAGTTIFSVALQAGTNGENTLKSCATDAAKGYFAIGQNDNVEQKLTAAFETIAGSIAKAATNGSVTDPMSQYVSLAFTGDPKVTNSLDEYNAGGYDVYLSQGTVTRSGETLNWNVGDINEGTPAVMKYRVTLKDNVQPDKTYPTNDTTTFNYTDYQDQETSKNFEIPEVAPKGGTILMHFYLVNAQGKPINEKGVEVESPDKAKQLAAQEYYTVNNSQALEYGTYNVPMKEISGTAYYGYTLDGVTTKDVTEASVTVSTTNANREVWFAYTQSFYVVHVQMDENGQGKQVGQTETYPFTGSFDLTAHVSQGYLYGGAFNSEACTDVYPFADGETGLNFAPKAGETYYIWEVPSAYLKPMALSCWEHNTEGQLDVIGFYMVSAIDRALYKEAGFYVNGTRTTANQMTYEAIDENRTTVANLPEGQSVAFKGITINLKQEGQSDSYTAASVVTGDKYGYMLCYGLDKDTYWSEAGKAVSYYPYWVTLDGVEVTNSVTRTGTYQGTGAGKIKSTDESRTADCTVPAAAETQLLTMASYCADGTPISADVPTVEDVTVTVVDGAKTYELTVSAGTGARDQISYQAPAGKVFAGWFTDEACTTPANLDSITQDTTIYAKYVSDSYLDLHYVRNGLFRLRGVTLISAVDNPANYQESGIIVDGVKVPVAYANRYRLFYTASGLFGAARNARLMITQQSLSGSGTLEVTPYWVTLDGTEVHGVTHTLHYNTRTIWE
jgi:uncharacterized repeat protein (TIGR02543 family)